QPIDSIFLELKQKPLAAASIGQVHEAVLHTNDRVAVKIQRPHIQKTIKTDLEILQDLATDAEYCLDCAGRNHVCKIVDEFARMMKKELEYRQEGRNADRIANQFKNNPHIHIRKINWNNTTNKMLTMEYVKGTKINDLTNLE